MAEASKVPFEFPPKAGADATSPESVHAGLSELSLMARQAFEEKRRKQSLALTNAILKIDPDNREALVLQSWIRADLQKELDTATRTFREAQTDKRVESYDRAERQLLSILGVDADYEKARVVLSEIRTEQTALVKSPASEEIVAADQASVVPPVVPTSQAPARRWVGLLLTLIVIAATAWFVLGLRNQLPAAQVQGATGDGSKAPPAPDRTIGSLDLLVLPLSGVKLSVDNGPAQDVPPTIELKSGTHQLVFTADGYVPESVSQTIVTGKQTLPVVMKRIGETAENAAKDNKPQSEAKAAPPDRETNSPRDRSAKERPEASSLGSLSVDAVVPVDVYFRGRRMGTTPLTFQLPPGEQTVEYRYQGLQKTSSYVVRKTETTRAIVAFDVDLQVNARPWAQVSLDGPQRRILGQTPLNTKVPVGSVLLFQNPRFPDKKYVVTGRDKTVQMVFP